MMTAINEVATDAHYAARMALENEYASADTPATIVLTCATNTTYNSEESDIESLLVDNIFGSEEETQPPSEIFTSALTELRLDENSFGTSCDDSPLAVLQGSDVDLSLGQATLQVDDDLNSTSPRNVNVKKVPISGRKVKQKLSSPNSWGPQQCLICSKVFGNTSALAKHKLTHSDERKYGCITCGKAFKRQDHLNGHMLTHCHKKPFECKVNGCGKSYCDARSLRRHTENHHTQTSSTIPTISIQAVPNASSCIQYASKNMQSKPKPQSLTPTNSPNSTVAFSSSVRHSYLKKTNENDEKDANSHNEGVISSVPVISTIATKFIDTSLSENSSTSTSKITKKTISKDNKNKNDPYESTKCKLVECSLCHRKFKNIPALNGHMRLHGGYFKKESDKKSERKESSSLQLTTASISVRALIEEKIIQKRSGLLNAQSKLQQLRNSVSPQIHECSNNIQTIHPLQTSTEIPSIPSQQVSPTSIKWVTENGESKPNEPQVLNGAYQSPQLDTNAPLENTEYFNICSDKDNSQYFTLNFTGNLNHSVHPLETISSTNINNELVFKNVPKSQGMKIEEITMKQHHNSHQDLQNIFNSPLTVNSFDDACIENNSITDNFNNLQSQSHLNSSNYVLTTPKDYSLTFKKLSSIIQHTQAASPLFTTFNTPTISTATTKKNDLDETLPIDVNQNFQSFPSSITYQLDTPELVAVPSSIDEFPKKIYKEDKIIYNLENVSTDSSHTENTFFKLKKEDNITLCADDNVNNNCQVTFRSTKSQTERKNNQCMSLETINCDRYSNSKSSDYQQISQDLNRKKLTNGNKEMIVRIKSKDCALIINNQKTIMLHCENQHLNIQQFNHQNNTTKPNISTEKQNSKENNNSENYSLHLYKEKKFKSTALQRLNIPKPSFPFNNEKYDEVLSNQTLHPSSAINLTSIKKQLDSLNYKNKNIQYLKLRFHRDASHMLHYTPCPILDPLRNSTGLYWQAICNTSNNEQGICNFKNEIPKNKLLIESDKDPHINIGPHFQAIIEPTCIKFQPMQIKPREDLLWEPVVKYGLMEKELEIYLEFACCASLPGGGRNKEYALHVLYLCHGNIQDAILKLMQPQLYIISSHPLLSYSYTENNIWRPKEIEIFQQSIMTLDKDFTQIAQKIETKTRKQCVQFYYLWKKACPEEYNKCRINWKQIRHLGIKKITNFTNKVIEKGEFISTLNNTRPYKCEFPECLAQFNSKAALNGHNRIHSKSMDKTKVSTCSTMVKNNTINSNASKEFPCKLCGKVFNKIKSRSAHMKSHRPLELEMKTN